MASDIFHPLTNQLPPAYPGLNDYGRHDAILQLTGEEMMQQATYVNVRHDAAADKSNPKDAQGSAKVQLHLVPAVADIEEALVMEGGAVKYGPYNWREGRGVRKSVYISAIRRHLAALQDGQWIDPESGHPHIAHIRANTGIMLDAHSLGKLIDDMPSKGKAADVIALNTKVVK